MAADITTLSGFQYRYTTTGFTGGVAGAVEFGSAWKNDAAANALSAIDKFPSLSSYSGVNAVVSTRASNGAMKSILQKTTGTTLNNAGIGVVLIGSAACGTDGLRRQAIVTCGALTTGHAWYGMTANGLTKVSRYSNAGEVTGKRVPCGRTCLIWGVTGSATYLKVLGTDAVVTGDIFGGETPRSNAWLHIGCDADGASTTRWLGSYEQVALFSTSDMSALAASIEAYATENLGITTPTKGHVICLGDSYGTGAYGWFADLSWPGQVAQALPDWFVVNNCRGGYKIGDIYTNRATLIDAAADRPLGATKPLLFIIDAGRNDPLNNRTQSQMQTDMETLVSYLRTTYPTCGIVVCTNNPTGVITGGGVVTNWSRLSGFNAWLTAGNLARYGVRVCDVAAIPQFVPASGLSGDIDTVCTSSYYTIYDTTPSATNDKTHLGPTGIELAKTVRQESALDGAQDALGSVPCRALAVGII